MPKKKASNKKRKEAKTQSTNSSPFVKILLGILSIVIAINAAVAYFAFQFWIVQQENQQLSVLAQNYAQEQTRVVTAYIRDMRDQLHTFTQRDDLLSALQNSDQPQLNTIQTELRRQFNTARGIRIDLRNTVELDPDNEVPINFAELDMINRANRREQVRPEAVQRGGEWRINMVEPIPYLEAGTETPPPPVASLFISFNATDMLSALGTTDLSNGRIILLQQFQQGDPQAIVSFGQGESAITERANIPQSNWIIEFTPSRGFADQANVSATVLVLVLFLWIVATMGGGVYATQHISRVLSNRMERIAVAEKVAAELKEGEKTAAVSNKKLMEMKVQEEDVNILNLKERAEVDPLDIANVNGDDDGDVPISIFRSYDIRGTVPKQLSPANVVLIGKAIGSQALEAGEKTLVVGRDGRIHSPDVCEQLIEGILSTGCNVINLGMVPTPLVYFAIEELQTTNSGVSVTASHNPAEYNGFKIVINHHALVDDEITALHSRIVSQQFAKGAGKEDFSDLSFQYIDKIASDIALPSELKVVVDAGNGVAGDIAPKVFTEIGCEVIPLHCKVDGTFPNHQPDPSVEKNLQELIAKVQAEGADLGIALDGDGDRLGVVTASGAIIWPDRLLMLFAKDVLSRNPGTDVLFDVKCSRELNNVISSYGGRPIMWKSGHSHMKSKMRETKASVGGELSGHIFIAERWYGFDDGVYAAARLMEIMSLREEDLDSIFSNFPSLPSTPEIKLPIGEAKKFALMKRLVAEGDFGDGRLTTIDGLRVDFEDGWGLVRASNTSPALTLRFEAETEETLAKIKAIFKQQINNVDPQLGIGF